MVPYLSSSTQPSVFPPPKSRRTASLFSSIRTLSVLTSRHRIPRLCNWASECLICSAHLSLSKVVASVCGTVPCSTRSNSTRKLWCLWGISPSTIPITPVCYLMIPEMLSALKFTMWKYINIPLSSGTLKPSIVPAFRIFKYVSSSSLTDSPETSIATLQIISSPSMVTFHTSACKRGPNTI